MSRIPLFTPCNSDLTMDAVTLSVDLNMVDVQSWSDWLSSLSRLNMSHTVSTFCDPSGVIEILFQLWQLFSKKSLELLSQLENSVQWSTFRKLSDFCGRIDVEAETPILWPPDVKSWLIWKDPDAWKDWGQEEKGLTEDEMVGCHHWLNGHGFG